ncbi:Endonuclease [Candidatus Desulfarcum epimagneticum]|uniref:Endonuclease n=1 Tax=uncultured Desulfobacteraceae bacterium TaxID=218296 RepID=A0A484HJC1_9BACT|nr:Endonuclease [uncultured Desulfobacteraceae bacterium]
MKRIAMAFAGSVMAVFLLLAALFYLSTYHPEDVQEEPVVCPAGAPLLEPGQTVKVLSWNVQFMAGNQNNHFFFDDGKDPWPPRETIDAVIQRVADVIRDENPDILLLQEVDHGAERTFHEDQLRRLLEKLPEDYACHSSAFYWKAAFVPHPSIMGSVGMKLSIVSRYKIDKTFRHALSPIPTDSFILRHLKPKRAAHEALMPVRGGAPLHVINVHLTAFAKGTDVQKRQAAQVTGILDAVGKRGRAGFAAGDFNLTPPPGSGIQPLFDAFHAVPSLEDIHSKQGRKCLTHMDTREKVKAPDKTIDYMFFTRNIPVGRTHIRQKDALDISDHLPVTAVFTVPGG